MAWESGFSVSMSGRTHNRRRPNVPGLMIRAHSDWSSAEGHFSSMKGKLGNVQADRRTARAWGKWNISLRRCWNSNKAPFGF
jgi:hypothetical protein